MGMRPSRHLPFAGVPLPPPPSSRSQCSCHSLAISRCGLLLACDCTRKRPRQSVTTRGLVCCVNTTRTPFRCVLTPCKQLHYDENGPRFLCRTKTTKMLPCSVFSPRRMPYHSGPRRGEFSGHGVPASEDNTPPYLLLCYPPSPIPPTPRALRHISRSLHIPYRKCP